jgi:hypothetical protein
VTAPVAASLAPPPPPPAVPFTPPPRAVPVAAPAPPPPPTFTQQPHRSISIEERLGQNWLNKLGITTLVIGLALFLGYQLRTLGPAGKSAIGLTLSLALLGGGLLLERRSGYRIFARAAIGGGWALTFFVTFAIYHVPAMQVLHSQAVDLVLMFLIASAMVIHSLHYRSQVVTSLAFLLAFVTVGISEVTLFSLVAGALLAAGLSTSLHVNTGTSSASAALSVSISTTSSGSAVSCLTARSPATPSRSSSPAPHCCCSIGFFFDSPMCFVFHAIAVRR